MPSISAIPQPASRNIVSGDVQRERTAISKIGPSRRGSSANRRNDSDLVVRIRPSYRIGPGKVSHCITVVYRPFRGPGTYGHAASETGGRVIPHGNPSVGMAQPDLPIFAPTLKNAV